MTPAHLIILIILPVIFCPLVLTPWLADKKGRSPVVWFVAAFFLSWLALIAIAVLKPSPRTAVAAGWAPVSPQQSMAPLPGVCPRCGTRLNPGFVVCPKCGLNTATGR
jgi:hypothetical protein